MKQQLLRNWPGSDAATSGDFLCERLQRTFTRANHLHWTAQYGLNLQLGSGGGSSHPCLDCLKKRQSQWASYINYKVKCKAWWSTSTFENSCGCTALDMPEWREMAEQIDWQAGKATLTNSLLLNRPEMLSSLRHYRQVQSQGLTPLITWKRESWKKEVLDNLPWKDERGPWSIRWTLEPFQRQHWRNFCEMGWSTYGLFQAHRYHLELNWSAGSLFVCLLLAKQK